MDSMAWSLRSLLEIQVTAASRPRLTLLVAGAITKMELMLLMRGPTHTPHSARVK